MKQKKAKYYPLDRINKCNCLYNIIIGKRYLGMKEALQKVRVQEKALKIILKKNVNIIYLKRSPTLDEYNLWTCGEELTKVEFDFLKEVLEYINLKEGDSYEE